MRLGPHVVERRWVPGPEDRPASEPERARVPEDPYALAVELLDRTADDFGRIHTDIEHVVQANVLGWLQCLPDALAAVGRAGDALALAERLLEHGDFRLLRASLPRLLVGAGRGDEARAAIEENLEKEPDDARVLYETALAYRELGDREREEQHLREALGFVGTMQIRRDVVDRLMEVLREDGRSAELEALRRAEVQRSHKLRESVLGRTVTPHVRTAPKVGRNDPCPCGSGKKHKKCCGAAARSGA